MSLSPVSPFEHHLSVAIRSRPVTVSLLRPLAFFVPPAIHFASLIRVCGGVASESEASEVRFSYLALGRYYGVRTRTLCY